MSDIQVITSHRIELLAEALTDTIASSLPDPVDPEIIVVQSRGMQRWLSLHIAQRFGVCAHIDFPFPNTIVQQLFSLLLPEMPEVLSFDPRRLTWVLMKKLDTIPGDAMFEQIRAYLSDNRQLKRFQLARVVADLFDQYTLFRPSLITQWESEQSENWQAYLWRECTDTSLWRHRETVRQHFFAALNSLDSPPGHFPRRISLFGISFLPQFHLEILAAISRFTEVTLYILNPCREYWYDIVSPNRAARMKSTALAAGKAAPLHLDIGNPLLASMGQYGADFLNRLLDCTPQEHALPFDIEPSSLLTTVHYDIVTLKNRGADGESPPVSVAEDDTTIQIHSCHTHHRETEVLFNSLLDLFQKNPGLRPSEIVVMCPDIETYAPYIKAVFSNPPPGTPALPFSIADRRQASENPIFDSFLVLLSLDLSRLSTIDVLTFLDNPAIQSSFGLSETDIKTIHRWVDRSNIYWGIDHTQWESTGVTGGDEFSWEAGMNRLLLGYAMDDSSEEIFRGITPCDGVEGSEAAVLSAFIRFINTLFHFVRSVRTERTIPQWCAVLDTTLTDLFEENSDTIRYITAVRNVLVQLEQWAESAGFNDTVAFEVVRAYIKNQGMVCRESGFLTGGITFCGMLPMRSIPFRVVCMIGMNEDAFPRHIYPAVFNRIAADPRRGDRSIEKEDRYLFLETILSAREYLYISYIGQRIADNALCPPSILVSELIEYLESACVMPGNEPVSNRIVSTHRLHAHHPDYFTPGSGLFSYSSPAREMCARNREEKKDTPPLIATTLPAASSECKTVSLGDLCRFFNNPAAYLCKNRLGISLELPQQALEEKEPFTLNPLFAYLLAEKIVASEPPSALSPSRLYHFYKSAGMLPAGTLGEIEFHRVFSDVCAFTRHLQSVTAAARCDPLPCDFTLDDFRITGTIDTLTEKYLLRYRFARLRPVDRIYAWILHCVLNCIAPPTYPKQTACICRDSSLVLAPLDNPHKHLHEILTLYWNGLQKPLHFFPITSWCYAENTLIKNRPEEYVRDETVKKWYGNDYSRGEKDNSYYRFCFGATLPLDAAFEQNSRTVFSPLIDAQRREIDG
jgi:exodeoxyribonuclease V gamma subunit